MFRILCFTFSSFPPLPTRQQPQSSPLRKTAPSPEKPREPKFPPTSIPPTKAEVKLQPTTGAKPGRQTRDKVNVDWVETHPTFSRGNDLTSL